ncbi:HIT family protein [Candidatus Pacearchaeota archaeon]|nr:HIT family protein [Candidatus Pacearchaeota archaeon]
MNEDCIFCKIAMGEIESYTLYEDEIVRAFLDVSPVSKGHILVVPKKHYENIFETSDEVLEKISIVCKKMAFLCRDKLGATGVNIINASGKDAQQSVFHLHYHVVARYGNDELDLWFHGKPDESIDVKEVYNLLK